MTTRLLHRGLALSLMGLASMVACKLRRRFDADLPWRDIVLERNMERNADDFANGTSRHHRSSDVDVLSWFRKVGSPEFQYHHSFVRTHGFR